MSGLSGLVCAQVTITLTDKEGATELLLVQKEVPEEERERTEKGWKGLLFDRSAPRRSRITALTVPWDATRASAQTSADPRSRARLPSESDAGRLRDGLRGGCATPESRRVSRVIP